MNIKNNVGNTYQQSKADAAYQAYQAAKDAAKKASTSIEAATHQQAAKGHWIAFLQQCPAVPSIPGPAH